MAYLIHSKSYMKTKWLLRTLYLDKQINYKICDVLAIWFFDVNNISNKLNLTLTDEYPQTLPPTPTTKRTKKNETFSMFVLFIHVLYRTIRCTWIKFLDLENSTIHLLKLTVGGFLYFLLICALTKFFKTRPSSNLLLCGSMEDDHIRNMAESVFVNASMGCMS